MDSVSECHGILAIKEDDSVRFDYIVVVQNWLSEARALLSAPRK